MKVNLIKECPFCGTVTAIKVEAGAYRKYAEGELAQRAFPELTPAEREVVITGMCIDCQHKIFGED